MAVTLGSTTKDGPFSAVGPEARPPIASLNAKDSPQGFRLVQNDYTTTTLRSRAEASITSYFNDLQASSEAVRLRGFRNLRIHIDVFAKTMAPEVYSRTMEDLCDRLHSILQTWRMPEVFSVVLAIDSLVSIRSVGELHDEATRNCCSRFIAFLRRIIGTLGDFNLPTARKADPKLTEKDIWSFIIIEKTVMVLGRVAQQGTRLRMNTQDLINYDLHRAFDWLSLSRSNGSEHKSLHDASLSVGVCRDNSDDLASEESQTQYTSQLSSVVKFNKRSRQLVGLFVLKEFAYAVPAALDTCLNAFFSAVWAAIQNEECAVIREAGLECLRAALRLIHKNVEVLKAKIAYYGQIWKEIRDGLQVGRDPSDPDFINTIHKASVARWTGALLALAELIDQRNHSDRYMWPRFSLACVLTFKFTKPAFACSVREACIRVIPQLAMMEPQRFVIDGWLKKSITFFLACLDGGRQQQQPPTDSTSTLSVETAPVSERLGMCVDPAVTFIALGDVITAVQHHITPMVDALLPYLVNFPENALGFSGQSEANLSSDMIKLVRQAAGSAFIQRAYLGTSSQAISREAFSCLIKLLKAVGPRIIHRMPMLIDRMCSGGLTANWFVGVQQIAETLPAASLSIQARIVHFLAEPLSDTDTPRDSSRETLGHLALAALGRLGVDDPVLNQFILDAILHYIEEGSNSELRCRAALTGCQILLPKTTPIFLSRPTNAQSIFEVPRDQAPTDTQLDSSKLFSRIDAGDDRRALTDGETPIGWTYMLSRSQAIRVQEVLDRLVTYIVTEVDPVARAVVLTALNPKFDPFLLQPARTIVLAQLLYDNDLNVRKAALRVFSRLAATRHPVVVQAVDQLAFELLTMLEEDFPWPCRDEAATLLADLTEVATCVILPYSSSLLSKLLNRLQRARHAIDALKLRAAAAVGPSAVDVVYSGESHSEWSAAAAAAAAHPLLPVAADVLPQTATQPPTFPSGPPTCSPELPSSSTTEPSTPIPLSYVKSLLRAITALCDVVPSQDLEKHMNLAMDVLLGYLLHDASGTFWLVEALNAMTSVISNSCHPVATCRAYPVLLPFLLQVVQTTPPGLDASPAALRCIGALGAIDPSQFAEIAVANADVSGGAKPVLRKNYKKFLSCGRLGRPIRSQMLQRRVCPSDARRQAGDFSTLSLEAAGGGPAQPALSGLSNEEDEDSEDAVDLFSRHAVVELLKLLEDIAQPPAVKAVSMRTLFRVLRGLKQGASYFAPLTVPCILEMLTQSTDWGDRTEILYHTRHFVAACRRAFQPFLVALFDVLEQLLEKLAVTQESLFSEVPSPANVSSAYRSLRAFEEFKLPAQAQEQNLPTLSRDASSSAEVSTCATEVLVQALRAILSVVHTIFRSSRESAVAFVQQILIKCIRVLRGDASADRAMACCILETLEDFGGALTEVTFMLVPHLLVLLTAPGTPSNFKIVVLAAFRTLALHGDLSLFIPSIIRPLCQLLPGASTDLVVAIAVTLKILRAAYRTDFEPFSRLLRTQAAQRLNVTGMLGSVDNALSELMLLREKGTLTHTMSPFDLSSRPLGSTLLPGVFGRRLFTQCKTSERQQGGESQHDMHRPTLSRRPLGSLRRREVRLSELACEDPVSHEHWNGEPALRQIWSLRYGASTEEIEQWLRRLTVEMIKESPVYSIRTCSAVVQYNSTLSFSREIFPTAFLSCWMFLSDSGKLEMTEAVTNALSCPNTSLPDLHQILNLAEAMGLQGESLLIDLDILARVTERCHAYAKALRYRELDWETRPGNIYYEIFLKQAAICWDSVFFEFLEACVEPLIGLYYSLQQTDAAQGVLNYAKKHFNTTLKESWYGACCFQCIDGIDRNEKLRKWRVALTAYEIQQLHHPNSVEWLKGRMRCLYALGHWDQVSLAAAAAWDKGSPDIRDGRHRAEIASIAAAAELNLRNFDRMQLYTEYLQMGAEAANPDVEATSEETATTHALSYDRHADSDAYIDGHPFEAAFFGAILKIQDGQFAAARKLLKSARAVLAVELTALLGESYARAYRSLVKVQQLFELEEVMLYKETEADSSKRKHIRDIWAERLLEGCQPETEVWHSILQVRSIVLRPHEDVSIWLKFAARSRKQERYGIAWRVVEDLSNDSCRSSEDPRVSAAHIKNIFAFGEVQRARDLLQSFCASMTSSVRLITADKNTPVVSLLNVCRRFPISELITLNEQMSHFADETSPPLRRRLLTPARIQILASARLLGARMSATTMERFKSLGLTTRDIDVLLSDCHRKLAAWTRMHYVNQTSSNGTTAPFTQWLDFNIPYPHVINGMNLGGWCHTPDALREVILAQRIAVQVCPEMYKGWKAWAELNFELSQIVDMTRHDRRQFFNSTRLRKHKQSFSEPTATLSLESCPYLYQIDEEMSSLQKAWSYACCRCMCHERARLENPLSSSDSTSWKGMDRGALLQGLATAQRSAYAQVRQHLVFVVEAAGGFLRSIGLRPQLDDIQSSLRFLTVWFRHSDVPELVQLLKEAIRDLPTTVWLPVLPQILARLKTNQQSLKETVGLLLHQVADVYPESLIFPLIANVSSGDSSCSGADAADLLGAIAVKNSTLVDEGKLVSQQLIQVSILSAEQWHETLEQASRFYYTDKDTPRAVRLLLKAYKNMQLQVESFAELSFVQTHARDLSLAHLYLQRFVRANPQYREILSPDYVDTGTLAHHAVPATWERQAELDQAWQIFYRVFSKLCQQITRMTQLDLEYVSSKLKAISGMHIAIPGHYTIQSFLRRVDVFASKQRPRKVTIIGSDGCLYPFLLKGHEDLRQDQRVMQVLRLINRLLFSETSRAHLAKQRSQKNKAGRHDHFKLSSPMESDIHGGTALDETIEHRLTISVYAVIPLSSNSGLIEWLSQCDTMHSLVKRYREAEDIKLSLELDLLKSLYSKFEELSLLQKIEAFDYTLDRTAGEDLREVLWRTSENSESWLERRSNFTTSLGVMSMAGYVLGLGDRHPSNLMLRRGSARIVHIDFGDCFEVAMLRDQFPEKIPFRLTRMMLNAMEIGGLEGQFRLTCERVLKLLRSNKDAVMATLETFVYDPLVTWKLLLPQHKKLERLLATSEPLLPCSAPHTSAYRDICCYLTSHCSSCGTTRSRRVRPQLSRVRSRTMSIRRRSYTDALHQKVPRPVRRSSEDSVGNIWAHTGVEPLSINDIAPHNSVEALRLPRPHDQLKRSDYETTSDEDDLHTDHWEDGDGSELSDVDESAKHPPRLLLPTRLRRAFIPRDYRMRDHTHFEPPAPEESSCRNFLGSKLLSRRRQRPLALRSSDSKLEQCRSLSSWRDLNGHSMTASSSSRSLNDLSANPIVLSRQAEMVLERVETKLNGTDFGREQLSIPNQVDRLIEEATLKENLAQCFVGWCAFW